jgi:hypothetical protein
MVDWPNFTFGYFWHVLAAFGMNRGGCQAEIRQVAGAASDKVIAGNLSAV